MTLVASGLSKGFGANQALEGVDLELFGSEVVVLMRANGAGKSTLVKILCGLGRDIASAPRIPAPTE
jgi:ABC-type sugar transport system ATPase subunit